LRFAVSPPGFSSEAVADDNPAENVSLPHPNRIKSTNIHKAPIEINKTSWNGKNCQCIRDYKNVYL
jgi:hypothetical protein